MRTTVVILDTNIYIQDYLMTNAHFTTFLDGCAQAGCKLLVPDVVLRELVNRYGMKICEAIDKHNKGAIDLHRFAWIDIQLLGRVDLIDS